MSGIAHLQGPGTCQEPTPSQVPQFTQPAPGALHIAMPVLPPASPMWTTNSPAATTVPVPTPPSQAFYVTNPPVVPSPPSRDRRAETPAPRPRKPYTTTKIREMWTPSEHERMLEGLRRYKRDWAKVTSFVGTRSAAQVRSHAQKYFDKVARDKTDEYVPRARPKRKSSTPYPRKVREEPPKSQPVPRQTYRAPVPAPYQVPVVHPPPSPFDMQPVAFASPHLHHPVRIAPGQSPILSHVSTSPYITQEQQHTVSGQPAVQHQVYSPYMEVVSATDSIPHQRNEHVSPEMQASPVSYVSGQTYATHSPSTAQQTISVPAAPVYGMISPITPGAFPFSPGRAPSITHTPMTVYQQPTMVRTQMPMAVPRHSHPEGPVESCSKCAALQRYGGVLQEIGELNYVHGQPESQVMPGGCPPGISMETINPIPPPDLAGIASIRKSGTQENRAPATPDAVSPRHRKRDTSSPEFSDEAKEHCTFTASAGNRAHRAKVMKARKFKRRSNSAKERSENRSGVREDESESANSTQENRRVLQPKDSKSSFPRHLSESGRPDSRKRKVASHIGGEAGKRGLHKHELAVKKPRTSLQVARDVKIDGLGRDQTRRDGNKDEGKRRVAAPQKGKKFREPGKRRPPQEATTKKGSTPSPKSDGSESGRHSPLAENYSPKERMELFDAVHSLQILAKTSSSSPRSSPSKGDAQRSEED